MKRKEEYFALRSVVDDKKDNLAKEAYFTLRSVIYNMKRSLLMAGVSF